MEQEKYGLPRVIEESDRSNIEEQLWESAETLSQKNKELESKQKDLERQISNFRQRQVNLHEQEVLTKLEREYWLATETISTIKSMEADLQVLIEKLDARQLTYDEVEHLVPQNQPETTKISKKKAAILREQENIARKMQSRGYTQDDIRFLGLLYAPQSATSIHAPGGPNAARLTTGRNLRKIKTGSVDLNEFNAPGEFFNRTADSHGGKVGHGKSGDKYVSKSGKKIRKH